MRGLLPFAGGFPGGLRGAAGVLLLLSLPGVAAPLLGPPLPAETVRPDVPRVAQAPVPVPDAEGTPEPAVPDADLDPVEPTAPTDWYAERLRLDDPLSLDDAVGQSLTLSPVIAAAGRDVTVAREMLNAIRARTAPQVGVTSWLTYGDGNMMVTSPGGLDPMQMRMVPGGLSWDTQFKARFPLYTGGRLESDVRAARADLAATEAELAALRQDLALSVRTLAWRVLYLAARAEVFEREAEALAERLRVDTQRYEVGKIPQYYLFRDEAELADARQRVIEARRDETIALADLRTVLGVHPLSGLTLIPAGIPTPVIPEVETALDLAARRRPELEAARARVLAAGHREDAAAAAFRPQVDLLGMADLMANRGPRWENYLAGVAVGLPLFDGGERLAEVRAARARQERLADQQETVALQVARDVIAARERLIAAVAAVATAEEALEAAREDYTIATARYEAGKSINVEVLDALAAQVRAETNQLEAVYELAAAQDALRRATGDPSLLEPEGIAPR